jgi:hypothetical protein
VFISGSAAQVYDSCGLEPELLERLRDISKMLRQLHVSPTTTAEVGDVITWLHSAAAGGKQCVLVCYVASHLAHLPPDCNVETLAGHLLLSR